MYGRTDSSFSPSLHITQVVSERLKKGNLGGLEVKIIDQEIMIGDDKINSGDIDDLVTKLKSRLVFQFISKTNDLESFFSKLEGATPSTQSAKKIHQIVDKLHFIQKVKDVFEEFLKFCDSIISSKDKVSEQTRSLALEARDQFAHILHDKADIESFEKKSNDLIACLIDLKLANGDLSEVEIKVENDILLIAGLEINIDHRVSLDTIWNVLRPHLFQNTDEIAEFYTRLNAAVDSLSIQWKPSKDNLKENLEIIEAVQQQKITLESLISIPAIVIEVLEKSTDQTKMIQDFISISRQIIEDAKKIKKQNEKGVYKGNSERLGENISKQFETFTKLMLLIENKAPKEMAEIMKRLDVKQTLSGLSRLHVGARMFESYVVREELDDLTKTRRMAALGELNNLNLTPLQEAFLRGNMRAARALIASGADVNDKPSPEMRSLGIAAMQGNLEMLQLLIDAGADPFSCNALGASIFHIAIEAGNEEVLKLLLKNERMLKALDTKDIFGHTARQKASWNNNPRLHELIQQYAPSTEPLSAKPTAISQKRVIESLKKFIQLQKGDPNILPEGGNCYGLSFLQQYYFSQGKEDHFYKVLELINAWDGTAEGLNDASKVAGLPGDYNNLKELMEQWVNDIVWFQGMHAIEKRGQVHDRENQWKLVAPEGQRLVTHNIVAAKTYKNYTPEELAAELEVLEPGTSLDIGVSSESIEQSNHQVCVTRNKDGTFSFYDPNLEFKVEPFVSAQEVVSLIKNFVSIITLNNKSTEQIPLCELSVLKFE